MSISLSAEDTQTFAASAPVQPPQAVANTQKMDFDDGDYCVEFTLTPTVATTGSTITPATS